MVARIAERWHTQPHVVGGWPYHYYWALRCQLLISAKRDAEAVRVNAKDGDVEDRDIDAEYGVKS